MVPTIHTQKRYDHRLRELVQKTQDVSCALQYGVPRSTARSSLTAPGVQVVTADPLNMDALLLQQEVLRLRTRIQKLIALLRVLLVVLKISRFALDWKLTSTLAYTQAAVGIPRDVEWPAVMRRRWRQRAQKSVECRDGQLECLSDRKRQRSSAMKHDDLGLGLFRRPMLLAALGGLGLWGVAFGQSVPSHRGSPAAATANDQKTARATNFAQDFQSAMALYYGGKLAEAKQAFLNLYEQKTNSRGADECLAQAACCALDQKEYDEALGLAGKIKDGCLNRLCRMNILRTRGKWDEVLGLGQDEDFDTWPDRLMYDAYLCRGRAYAVEKNAPKAEHDFLAAAKSTLAANNKASAYHFLGDLYRDVIKDPQKAINAYGEVLKLKPSFRFLAEAITARARLLASSGKGELAIAELDQVIGDTKDVQRRCAIQLCYGEVYERMGKKAEALAKYKTAAACSGAPQAMVATAKARAEAIENHKEGK